MVCSSVLVIGFEVVVLCLVFFSKFCYYCSWILFGNGFDMIFWIWLILVENVYSVIRLDWYGLFIRSVFK